jgi:hypothetical protein
VWNLSDFRDRFGKMPPLNETEAMASGDKGKEGCQGFSVREPLGLFCRIERI